MPPFEPKKAFDIEKIKAEIPELPAQKRARYQKMGLNLQDAEILSLDSGLAQYYENVSAKIQPKLAANWIINELKAGGILAISPENMIELLKMIEDNEISGKIAKDILAEMIETGKSPAEIIESKGLKQIGDEAELISIVEKVIAENPQVIDSIKAGKREAIGYLVGQVMKKSGGRANPQITNQILKERIK